MLPAPVQGYLSVVVVPELEPALQQVLRGETEATLAILFYTSRDNTLNLKLDLEITEPDPGGT